MNAAFRVEIDRLVLDGLELTPAEAEQLRSEVATELAKLLGVAQRSWPLASGKIYRQRFTVQTPLVAAETGAWQATFASQVAQGLAGSVQVALRRYSAEAGSDHS